MTKQRRPSSTEPAPPKGTAQRSAKAPASPRAAARPADKKPPPGSPRRSDDRPPRPASWRRRLGWWALAAAGVILVLSVLLIQVFEVRLPFVGGRFAAQAIDDPDAPLAPFFTAEVLRWRDRIDAWAQQYHVNPNVLAIVMQIESCGDPLAISSAGALGLMQVMPFHFPNGENMINPDTNVRLGMSVFQECLTVFADWDLGLALACYNGGPSVTTRDRSTWANETQYYYRWATGLWEDVKAGGGQSPTLDDWLGAGGAGLCQRAAL